MERGISALGILVVLAIAWLWSAKRSAIQIHTVVLGIGIQLLVAATAFVFPPGIEFFVGVGGFVSWVLGFAQDGAVFLFGNLASGSNHELFGFQFALTILPILIFIGSLTSLFYHWGILQRIVRAMSWVMQRTMRTSAIESLSAAANVFLGQIDAPLLVRHYLPNASKSELFAVMVGGYATIAGSMMGVYINMGIPAETIIIASLLAAPGGLLLAKIVMPEVEAVAMNADAVSHTVDIPTGNALDALARGAMYGAKVALSVIVVLIAFKSIIALLDASLAWASTQSTALGLVALPTSIDGLLGYACLPFAWLLGIPNADVHQVASLLGIKISQTEFLAYDSLASQIHAGTLSARSVTLSTIMLCGFANLMSVGIQIGGLGTMAPERRKDFARFGLKAMCVGGLASLLSAYIVGLFI